MVLVASPMTPRTITLIVTPLSTRQISGNPIKAPQMIPYSEEFDAAKDALHILLDLCQKAEQNDS